MRHSCIIRNNIVCKTASSSIFASPSGIIVSYSCVHRVAIGRLRVCVGSIFAFYQIREENRAKLKISYSCGHRVSKSARYDATLRPSHTEHGWAHGSNTVYSVIHGLTGTSIELQPCLSMSWYDLDSNVARVSTNKARIYSIKQCSSRFEHDLQTIFIRLFYGSKYGLGRSVTA